MAQNVMLPLREHAELAPPAQEVIAAMKLALAGLPADVGAKSPAQLSGGMVRASAHRGCRRKARVATTPAGQVPEIRSEKNPLATALEALPKAIDRLVALENQTGKVLADVGATTDEIKQNPSSLIFGRSRFASPGDKSAAKETVRARQPGKD